jgi:hypothetical protein
VLDTWHFVSWVWNTKGTLAWPWCSRCWDTDSEFVSRVREHVWKHVFPWCFQDLDTPGTDKVP